MTLATSCGSCAFWHQHGPHDGTCRRSAPLPTEAADEIAHWPMTDAQERCGEGIMRDQTPALVSCGECRFWHTNPAGGIDPQNRPARSVHFEARIMTSGNHDSLRHQQLINRGCV